MSKKNLESLSRQPQLIADLPDGLRESGAIEVREKLGTISGGDILDVGTEDGDFINTLMKTLKDYKSFVGIDISADDLKKAREKLKDAPVVLMEMNAEMMSFPDYVEMTCGPAEWGLTWFVEMLKMVRDYLNTAPIERFAL